MAAEDRAHWDERYAGLHPVPVHEVALASHFAAHVDVFPSTGVALELACGSGRAAVWMALRGLDVWAVDVSPVAIALAEDLAGRAGVASRCHFGIADLDDGLPPGPEVEVVMCHLFRDPRLDQVIVQRLVPGGLLAMTVLSEVDAGPGRFRARRGELREAFADLDVIESGERDGEAWLLGRRR